MFYSVASIRPVQWKAWLFLRQWLVAILLAALLLGCLGPTQSLPTAKTLVFDEPVEITLPGDPTELIEAPDGLLVVSRDGSSTRVFQSRDEGLTWTPGPSWSGPKLATCFHAGCGSFHGVVLEQSALRHQLLPDGPLEGVIQGEMRNPRVTRLACVESRRIGVLWADTSTGWWELYFSHSLDHGATWSAPVLVNHESRGKPILQFLGLFWSNRLWSAIWSESRRAETEFDLYSNSSGDGSVWSPTYRINDDSSSGWQFLGEGAADESGRIFVVFSDYRELNPMLDRDESVYFSRLEPRHRQASPNVRVNDVGKGQQSFPQIAYDAQEDVLVATWTDQRNHLFGDVYSSFSTDGGQTWSSNQRVNSNRHPLWTGIVSVAARPGGAFVFLYLQRSPQIRWFLRRARVVTVSDEGPSPESLENPGQREGPLLDHLTSGPVLHHDSFESAGNTLRPLKGQWVTTEGALLAFGRDYALAELPELHLRDFVLEGRFRLNPMAHRSAVLGFRARRGQESSPSPLHAYAISNRFRQGITLTEAAAGLFPIFQTIPLADRWFSFQNNTWYRFRLVVAGSALDYYVDEEWMLSFEGLSLEPGSLLLGADFPVEFDDLKVSALSEN